MHLLYELVHSVEELEKHGRALFGVVWSVTLAGGGWRFVFEGEGVVHFLVAFLCGYLWSVARAMKRGEMETK